MAKLTPVFLPGEILRSRGVWWAIVHGVTKELDMTQQLNNNSNSFLPSFTRSHVMEGTYTHLSPQFEAVFSIF